jgi:NADH-quinone oxidoreductase subunit N
MSALADKLEWIKLSLGFSLSELVLSSCVLLLLLMSVLWRKTFDKKIIESVVLLFLGISLAVNLYQWNTFTADTRIFNGLLHYSRYSLCFNMLFDLSGILTVWLSWNTIQAKKIEYYTLILTAITGAHLLVMSVHFVMVFLSIELISIPSYLLAAFHFQKKGMEAAMKYFLFGSVASAVMLYGISLLFGITETLDFTSTTFSTALLRNQSHFLFLAICFALAGLLYKIASAPMHFWAPDVYEAAPMPVVAFFSVVPKLAGIGILIKFYFVIHLHGQSLIRWQIVLSMVTLLTLVIGNFGALVQKHPRRMMAYSSIAQAGFIMIGPLATSIQGVQFMLFYAIVFLISNYLVFYYLDYFEKRSISTIHDYQGTGRAQVLPAFLLLVGLLALTGLPPTAGFTAKLLIFSSLWSSYESSGRALLLFLLTFGLLNTVLSLFFYLKIPYQAFLKEQIANMSLEKSLFSENLLGLLLVSLLLLLFFHPSGLMGWLNRITFAW